MERAAFFVVVTFAVVLSLVAFVRGAIDAAERHTPDVKLRSSVERSFAAPQLRPSLYNR